MGRRALWKALPHPSPRRRALRPEALSPRVYPPVGTPTGRLGLNLFCPPLFCQRVCRRVCHEPIGLGQARATSGMELVDCMALWPLLAPSRRPSAVTLGGYDARQG